MVPQSRISSENIDLIKVRGIVTGEPPICMLIRAVNSLRHSVGSCPSGAGDWQPSSPSTLPFKTRERKKWCGVILSNESSGPGCGYFYKNTHFKRQPVHKGGSQSIAETDFLNTDYNIVSYF